MRPLGIPVLEDKIVQQAVRMILESIWENDFVDESIGHRPGRSPRQGTRELSETLDNGKHRWVVEADIQKQTKELSGVGQNLVAEDAGSDVKLLDIGVPMIAAGFHHELLPTGSETLELDVWRGGMQRGNHPTLRKLPAHA
jgi:RNA-directed DNA polymerase